MKSEPVLTAGAVAGVIMAALTMAVSLGWLRLDETQMGSIQAFLVAALSLVVPVTAAFWARSLVTPTADPKLPDGEPAALVPRVQAQQMAASMGLHNPGTGDEEYTWTVEDPDA